MVNPSVSGIYYLIFFHLSTFYRKNIAAQTLAGLQLQLKGDQTHLKSLIIYQTDPLKN